MRSIVDAVILVCAGGPHSGFGQRSERRLFKAFIAEAAIDTLDEAVLHELSRPDISPVDLPVLGPAQDRHAGEFGTICH